MKHRIILAFAAMLLLASFDASAQVERHRPSLRPHSPAARGFGIDFGYVHSTYRTTDWASDEVENSAGLDGFTLGLTKDFTLVPFALYFQTGLEYYYQNDANDENVRVPASDLVARVVGDRTEHFLGIPVTLKYTYPITHNIGLAVEAGPTLLFGLSSKMKYRTRISSDLTSTATYNAYKGQFKGSDVSELFDVEDWMKSSGMLPESKIRRFDVLVGASLGADFFEILEVRLGYEWGLINRYKGDVARDLKMRRGQFVLTAAVRF